METAQEKLLVTVRRSVSRKYFDQLKAEIESAGVRLRQILDESNREDAEGSI